MKFYGLILGVLCWAIGGAIDANEVYDLAPISKQTWVRSFETWSDRAGYWGSVFVPMQALHELDNKMLRMTGHNFTIQQIRSNPKGPWVSGGVSGAGFNNSEPLRSLRPKTNGVTFQDYNERYQTSTPINDPATPASPPAQIPLSDLIVPSTRSR
jgi:hypothetical protein